MRRFGRTIIAACLPATLLWGAGQPALAQESAPTAAGTSEPAAQVPPPVLGVTFARSDIDNALLVAPHPVLPKRVILATDKGLMLSNDAGKEWSELDAATAETIGVIRRVTFVPDDVDTFYVGGDKGLWVTFDNGVTFAQVGSKSNGMAADVVVDAEVYQGDPSFRTLLACHGKAAGGLSVSYDGGRKWHVIGREYFVHRIVGGDLMGPHLLVVASLVKSPMVTSVYYFPALGELWEETLRDVVPTDVTLAALGPRMGNEWDRTEAYLATTDAGVSAVSRAGSVCRRIGPTDVDDWTCVGAVFGPVINKQLLYAYNPKSLGLIISLDGLATWTSADNLPVGGLITDASHVRANSNGTLFYAVINKQLWIGATYSEGIVVTDVNVNPPTLLYAADQYAKAKDKQREQIQGLARSVSAVGAARELTKSIHQASGAFADFRFTLTAQVLCPPGKKPSSVTVDLGPIGDSAAEPLFDDGQHGDGAAGDGVWGTYFRFNPNPDREAAKRIRWPGRLGLVVTAVSQDGKTSAGAAAVMSINQDAEDVNVFDEQAKSEISGTGAKVELVDDPSRAYSGNVSLRIDAPATPWSVSLGIPSFKNDGCRCGGGMTSLSFYVRTDGKASELALRLRDNPMYARRGMTNPVLIVKEGYVQDGAIGTDWRRVVVPMDRFFEDGSDFKPGMLRTILFGGEGQGGTYWIDDVRLLYSEDMQEGSLKAAPGRKQPVPPAQRPKPVRAAPAKPSKGK